ncbi:phage terminase large subunit family protein [Escherichia coli]|nr:phage terminase large subunit family protein [Escherichia coli]MQK74146.1 phage terminase large subunit family protein [Escherichia coli]
MNISNSQVNRLRHFVRAGLRSLFRPEPQTAVEWADANYYLPKESAYQEGRWETLPFQRAIMNAMGSDYIREVNVVKSARVGYSKMLLGVYAYFIEHKQRNTLIWLPTDGDAENFMKTHVEPTIRDIPSLLALAPWYGKKHRDNTLTMKRFSNGRGFWCLGGKAAKNYREKSVDVAGYDELAAFDEDIEQEGSPTFLGDKRIEGSVWPKSIRGSTPKVRGTCQIERAASESPHFMRFHVACPHCGEEQYLKFGDKETPFGLKWTPDDPSSVFYLCEHNACVIRQQELDFTDARYICEKTGIWTRDGILWFSSSGEEIEPPDSVTFHIWTAYSPFTTWVQIVKDWMKTKGDTGKRKTFVNTTLGETWEAKIGERPDAEVMAERKEYYSAPVPDRVAYLTAGIDSQLDRYEMRVWGWGPGEESWLIDRQIIMGRHDDEQTLLRVDEAINKTYTRRNGAEMSVSRICWDTGGIDPTIVYERSKKHGLFRVIPIKGASVYGKPVASMPRKRNKNGVYLTEIGTDTAKEQIYNRFTLTPEGDEPLPGAVHFPNIAPPDIPAGFVAVFNSDESSWHLVEDHRGKTVYDVASGDALFISELGPLPENVTWLSPGGEYQKWNGTAWVKDAEAEKLFRIREAEETKNSLMQVASEHIAPLQDAVDLEIATEEEISLLEAWKKYRVLLNRVDTSTAQDIEWPALP